MRLGAHESIAGGLYRAFERARSVGCESVQIFVKPNRSWGAKPLTDSAVSRFKALAAETDIRPVIAHTCYLLNLASPDDKLWHKSCDTLVLELERCERLGVSGLVLHPGSHVGSGEEAGMARVVQGLDQVHAATQGFDVRVLIETTSGQGSNLGYRFEQIAWLIENTAKGERLGVCLDTCHVFAAGYELRTREGYEQTMTAFDEAVGLERLEAIHLNDSQQGLGSRRDRHEHIGQGMIGLEGFRNLVNDPHLSEIPGLLETDKSADLHEDAENLAALRSLIE